MKKLKFKIIEIASLAAILVTIASLFASVCWISSSKAGGEADDMKTAALGFMLLRLESSTQSSTALVEAQTYLTQAAMYYAESDSQDDPELKYYLNSLGNQSIEMSNYHSSIADNSEIRAQAYYTNYSKTLELASEYSNVGDYRSTGALIFTMSAIVASSCGLFKRKELLYVYFPLFILALSYLVISLF